MDINSHKDDLTALSLNNKGDKYKLVGLYAYNAIYDADQEKTEDVTDGIVYEAESPIAGVYLNEKLEDDTLELVIPYIPSGGSGFKREDIFVLLAKSVNILRDIKERRNFASAPNRLGVMLRDYLLPEESTPTLPIYLHLLTNADTNERDRFELEKELSKYDTSVKGIETISASISYGEDIEAEIESNHAPFDCVKEGELKVDDVDNALLYSSDAAVYNVSALSLKELWRKEGRKGLLAMNLRYYIKNASIDGKIENSIKDDASSFWYLNNGIIIVCDDYSLKGNTLHLSRFSIVNGGQTTRMIGTIPFDNDFYLLAKIIKAGDKDMKSKNLFVSKVAEASNTQKPIKEKDIIANKTEQRNLKTSLADIGIFVEIKRGDKCDKSIYKEPWQRTKNNELAQDLYSFIYLQPGPARNNVSKILSDQNKYKMIFSNHEYDSHFLKSVLILEKAYRDYAKKVSKMGEEVADATKKGLVKNGMYYVLSIIGYLMKLAYNPSFVEAMRKYRGSDIALARYSAEMAVSIPFIDESKSYKDISRSLESLYDVIIDYCIKPDFNRAKEEKPELAYSNYTKTNTGFNKIKSHIEMSVLTSGDESFVNTIKRTFGGFDAKTIEKNVKAYEEYCLANAPTTGNNADGSSLSERDTALRDELMKYRLAYSIKKNIAEKNVFTDKTLERIVKEKPSSGELAQIIRQSFYYIGDDILAIINKYR